MTDTHSSHASGSRAAAHPNPTFEDRIRRAFHAGDLETLTNLTEPLLRARTLDSGWRSRWVALLAGIRGAFEEILEVDISDADIDLCMPLPSSSQGWLEAINPQHVDDLSRETYKGLDTLVGLLRTSVYDRLKAIGCHFAASEDIQTSELDELERFMELLVSTIRTSYDQSVVSEGTARQFALMWAAEQQQQQHEASSMTESTFDTFDDGSANNLAQPDPMSYPIPTSQREPSVVSPAQPAAPPESQSLSYANSMEFIAAHQTQPVPQPAHIPPLGGTTMSMPVRSPAAAPQSSSVDAVAQPPVKAGPMQERARTHVQAAEKPVANTGIDIKPASRSPSPAPIRSGSPGARRVQPATRSGQGAHGPLGHGIRTSTPIGRKPTDRSSRGSVGESVSDFNWGEPIDVKARLYALDAELREEREKRITEIGRLQMMETLLAKEKEERARERKVLEEERVRERKVLEEERVRERKVLDIMRTEWQKDKDDYKSQITRLQEQLFGLNETIRQLATRS